ncbi:hypothetical protein EYF80_052161 [Liparis tanakae]|uniref:Uncharacterized protein n=1 Tax=Liparis tanakae TaxID=230148 RepID=A0A4Z2F8V9_9TELE|nr:hypothetical protein EYF80_052161 [Liparis tanakae]
MERSLSEEWVENKTEQKKENNSRDGNPIPNEGSLTEQVEALLHLGLESHFARRSARIEAPRDAG